MTPAARVQAAIEVLDQILGGKAAEQALIGWARASRFAGSGDRAAVRDLVFDALRRRRSALARSGLAESGRALLIGTLGPDAVATLFGNGPHAPAALSDGERAARLQADDATPDPVRLDYPDWLDAPLKAALGADHAAVMAAQTQRAPVFLRVNLRRSDGPSVCAGLEADGIECRVREEVPGALEVTKGANKIKQSQTYLQGLVELQDLSSQAAVAALPLKDGMRILDYCAGGGGKTLAMASRVTGQFLAHDASAARMADLPARAARAGCAVRLMRKAELRVGGHDLVLVDAPCSGSGTWRRTPDAKWRLSPDRLAELCALQADILDEAAAFVRPGGLLAFMTCSLLRAENEDQTDAFLTRHPHDSLTDARRFSPLTGGDGFYMAVLRLS